MPLDTLDGRGSSAVEVARAAKSGVTCLSCLLLVAYLRRNRHTALKGDASAARKLILPAFEPLLWTISIAAGLLSLAFSLLLALHASSPSLLAGEGEYAGRQFVHLLIPVFLLQKSVSLPALRRSVLLSLALAAYTIPVAALLQSAAPDSTGWPLPLSRAAALAFYAFVALRPPARASPRALREYCAFVGVYHLILFASSCVFLSSDAKSATTLGHVLVFCLVGWSTLLPLIMWRVLRADTAHWRGLGKRACELQGALLRRRQTKQRDLHERISSQGLHVLIEMHRKYIIDFAYLELKQRIGAGASALVFRGLLHSRLPVAVKVYTPNDLTDETVAAFSHEAALCGALRHPNVVTFHGMCILPPTICLVSELCIGSLDDVTRVMARRPLKPMTATAVKTPTPSAMGLLSIGFMLDAARAVAYLHSFSPAFLHRDLKPANFLVDRESTVKLTDFGESRALPRPERAGGDDTKSNKDDKAAAGEQDESDGSARRLTVRGTVEYMAPELISGRAGTALYAEAADVYALGVTLWDVLYPGRDKFPQLAGAQTHHLAVFEAVLRGARPPFDNDAPTDLRRLLEATWASDATRRPTASALVAALERIQEQALAAFALDALVAADSDCSVGGEWTGEALAQTLMDCGAAHSNGESVRVGRALMDAGLLHHCKHSAGFEMNAQQRYFLDTGAASARILRVGSPPLPVDEMAILEDNALSRSERWTSSAAVARGRSFRSGEDAPSLPLPPPPPPLPVAPAPARKMHRRHRHWHRHHDSHIAITAAESDESELWPRDWPAPAAQPVYVDRTLAACACRRLGQRAEVGRSTRGGGSIAGSAADSAGSRARRFRDRFGRRGVSTPSRVPSVTEQSVAMALALGSGGALAAGDASALTAELLAGDSTGQVPGGGHDGLMDDLDELEDDEMPMVDFDFIAQV